MAAPNGRIGIVGTRPYRGWSNNLASACKANPHAEIVALTDIKQGAAEKFAGLHEIDVPTFLDYRDMLAMDGLDAVYVATPNHVHTPIAIAAAEAGKHVLCQKPMAARFDESDLRHLSPQTCTRQGSLSYDFPRARNEEGQMTTTDVYGQFLEILGLKEPTGMRKILEHLMTPDEATMALALPGTPAEVAEKTGFDIGRVRESLETLFFNGAVIPRGDLVRREQYRFNSRNLHDLTLASALLDVNKDHDFFQMWYDYKMAEWYPSMAKRMQRDNRRGDRIIPAYRSIKDLDGILPYENFPEMLKAQERIAVVPCSCRLVTDSIGERCDIHDEVEHWVCLLFGRSAEYAITRGSGKELTIDEALELNDVIEDSGLLHKWENHNGMQAGLSCQCCRDCCMLTVPIDQAGLNIDLIWEKSRYEAFVNQDDCDGCQNCLDRCLFDAIEMVKTEGSKKLKAVVDPEKCFGCGACVLTCDPTALKMKAVRPPEHIPAPTPRA